MYLDGKEYKIFKFPGNGTEKEFLAIAPVNATGSIAIRLAMKAAQKTGAIFSIETFDEPFNGSSQHEIFIWKNEPEGAIRELAETVKIYNKAMENLLNTAFNS